MKQFIVIIGLFCLLGYGGFMLQYYFAMEKSNEEGKIMDCKENIEIAFNGVITFVEKNDDSNSGYMGNFFSLTIDTEDTANSRISYQYLKKGHDDIMEFSDTGQIINKLKGQNYFTLTNNKGQTKQFIVPSCD